MPHSSHMRIYKNLMKRLTTGSSFDWEPLLITSAGTHPGHGYIFHIVYMYQERIQLSSNSQSELTDHRQ